MISMKADEAGRPLAGQTGNAAGRTEERVDFSMEDEDILELFWKRDENALRLTDRKYHASCYSIAWRILSSREDSEECVNDTWFAAWRSIPPQRPPRLVAYLGKITRGLAIDVLRKKHAAKRADTHMADIAGETENLNAALIRDPGEQLEAEELIGIINTFLDSLPDRDRDMFVQRYWAMEPIKNIAARHKLSEGAVKQNLLRSRRKLKKILEREGRL